MPSAWPGPRYAVGATPTHPPAGTQPSFTTSDGRRVWTLEPNRFLIQRDAGPDDLSVEVVFHDGWVESDEQQLLVAARKLVKGLVFGLLVSLPIWALIVWAVRRLLERVG